MLFFLPIINTASYLEMCNWMCCSRGVPLALGSPAGGGRARGKGGGKAGGTRAPFPSSPGDPFQPFHATGSMGQITLGSEQESKYKNDHGNCPTG